MSSIVKIEVKKCQLDCLFKANCLVGKTTYELIRPIFRAGMHWYVLFLLEGHFQFKLRKTGVSLNFKIKL
jgi:hypothetical protein